MELGIIRLKLHTPTTHSRRSLKASDGARSQGATKKRHPVRTVPSRNFYFLQQCHRFSCHLLVLSITFLMSTFFPRRFPLAAR